MKKLLLWIYPLMLLFFVLLFFRPFFIQGKLPIPADTVVGLYHPFRDFYAKDYPNGYPYKNFLITDPVLQQYPWKSVAIDGQKNFQLILWNPYMAAGEPLLGNIQSGSLYPFNILFYFINFSFAWGLYIVLQPLLAGLFTYLYLRNLKLSAPAALWGGIIFAFSGFMVAWLEWGVIGHTILWLPLMLFAIDKSLSQKSQKWSILFVFALCASFLSGHLQTFFYGYLVMFAYFIMRWWDLGRKRKPLLIFLLLNLCFFLLTSIQWLTTFQLIQESSRSIDQANWRDKDGWFLPWQHLLQFLAPDYFGNPATMNYWGVWNYAELVGYLGLFPLILGIFAVVVRREKVVFFFAGVAGMSLIMMLPHVLSQLPYVLNIPFLSTSQPTRLMGLVDFSLSILAAFGLSYLLHERKKLKTLIIITSIVFVGIVLAFAYIYFGLQSPTSEDFIKNALVTKRNLYLPLVLSGSLLIVTILLAVFSRKKKIFLVLILGVCLLTVFDLYRFTTKFTPFVDPSMVLPSTKITSFLSEQSQDYPWRFLGVDYVENQKRIFPPNVAAYYKLYTLDSYNPLLLRRYQEFAAVSEWKFTDIPDFSFNRILLMNNHGSRLVDMMGVKYIVSINPIENKSLKFLFNEGESRVYENLEVFPRAFIVHDVEVGKTKQDIARMLLDPKIDLHKTALVEESVPVSASSDSSTVKIKEYTENTITLVTDSKEQGFLVLTDNYYPTWHVKVCTETGESCEDKKIYRTNYSFRGVVVPAGKHTIIFYASLL